MRHRPSQTSSRFALSVARLKLPSTLVTRSLPEGRRPVYLTPRQAWHPDLERPALKQAPGHSTGPAVSRRRHRAPLCRVRDPAAAAGVTLAIGVAAPKRLRNAGRLDLPGEAGNDRVWSLRSSATTGDSRTYRDSSAVACSAESLPIAPGSGRPVSKPSPPPDKSSVEAGLHHDGASPSGLHCLRGTSEAGLRTRIASGQRPTPDSLSCERRLASMRTHHRRARTGGRSRDRHSTGMLAATRVRASRTRVNPAVDTAFEVAFGGP